MLFALRANHALYQLGVDIRLVDGGKLAAISRTAEIAGHSPQEVAVFIASQLPMIYRASLTPGIVRVWIRKNKLNAHSSDMRDAFIELGWFSLLGE